MMLIKGMTKLIGLKSDSWHFKKMLFWHGFVKNYWTKTITLDSFFTDDCKEMGPRMAHFWNFCANALIRVCLWSLGFATALYGLALLDFSFWSKIPCWQDGKWRNSRKNKGQVTCAPWGFAPKDWKIMWAYTNHQKTQK